jgi:hypothetical protein
MMAVDKPTGEIDASLPFRPRQYENHCRRGGADLSDDIAAMDSADRIARRLLGERPDLKNRHYSILVTNEDGDEVCRLPLDIIH